MWKAADPNRKKKRGNNRKMSNVSISSPRSALLWVNRVAVYFALGLLSQSSQVLWSLWLYVFLPLKQTLKKNQWDPKRAWKTICHICVIGEHKPSPCVTKPSFSRNIAEDMTSVSSVVAYGPAFGESSNTAKENMPCQSYVNGEPIKEWRTDKPSFLRVYQSD